MTSRKKKSKQSLVVKIRNNPKMVNAIAYSFILFVVMVAFIGPLIACYFFFGILLLVAAYEDYKTLYVHSMIILLMLLLVVLLYAFNGFQKDTAYAFIIWAAIFAILYMSGQKFRQQFGGADTLALMAVVCSFTMMWQIATFGASYIFWSIGSFLFQKRTVLKYLPHVPTIVLAYFNTLFVILITMMQKLIVTG